MQDNNRCVRYYITACRRPVFFRESITRATTVSQFPTLITIYPRHRRPTGSLKATLFSKSTSNLTHDAALKGQPSTLLKKYIETRRSAIYIVDSPCRKYVWIFIRVSCVFLFIIFFVCAGECAWIIHEVRTRRSSVHLFVDPENIFRCCFIYKMENVREATIMNVLIVGEPPETDLTIEGTKTSCKLFFTPRIFNETPRSKQF